MRQRHLAGWFTVFAGYAAVNGIFTHGPSSVWGAWAAPGYALAALASWRSRGSTIPLLIGAGGAVAAPTIWLATRLQPGEEPAVVARAAFLLAHHGSPYLPSVQMVSAQSYNPYLPAMSVFGLPYLTGLPGIIGNPETWMAVATLALAAAAIAIGAPPGVRSRAPGPGFLFRNTALAVVTPVLALPLALGTTDPPVIALMCLALACVGRSPAVGRSPTASPAPGGPAAGGPAGTGPWPAVPAARRITWNALAALALGTACAMKALAWPALPVIAAMIAVRQGPRAAARFAGVAAGAALVLILAFAPRLVTQPGAFADNIIAYPLGLAHQLTTAASPLPGHLLAGTGAPGHLADMVLLLAGAAAMAFCLARRPPRDTREATVFLALGLTLLFALAPDARFGYFAYPAALAGWLAIAERPRPRPETGRTP
ncbi:MAG TPA: hypothetical protein VGG75_34240 [Trebonia sp.]